MDEVIKLAEAFRAALLENDEDALIQGSVEGRCTLIDGNFDLIAVAERVLDRIKDQSHHGRNPASRATPPSHSSVSRPFGDYPA